MFLRVVLSSLLAVGVSLSLSAVERDGCSKRIGSLGKEEPLRDSFRQYIKTIRQYPLLSRTEITKLFKESDSIKKLILEKLFSTREGLEFISKAIEEQGDTKKRASGHYGFRPQSVCYSPFLLDPNATKEEVEIHKEKWVNFIKDLHQKIDMALSSGDLSSIKKDLLKVEFSHLFFRNRLMRKIMVSYNDYKKLGINRLRFDDEAFKAIERLIEIRTQISNANLRIVVSIAKLFRGRGIDLKTLIDMGNLELLSAVDSFNHRMNVAFSSYVTPIIKNALKMHIWMERGLIDVPPYLQPLINTYKITLRDFFQEHARAPRDSEVLKIMGIKPKLLRNIKDAIRASNIGQQSRRKGDGDMVDIFDLVEAPDSSSDPIDLIRLGELLESNQHLLELHKEILELYFGLHRDGRMTLNEIGSRVGLSRERVRQIKEASLQTLRRLMAE